ncbi:hypothetical protein HYALB_00008026 [Hymenoscyphus albidus]|uniref:Uncharacterized protein n=1 Tax=Hymenoscyphus albidus TaxID=595503 RepID=A0A9N9LFF9_9HELO|nr:hypothetical protein HYALB_00008026 [Hymenoscyphus albidus]
MLGVEIMSIISQDFMLNPEAATFLHPSSNTDSTKCRIHRLYFPTCGHTLTVATHDPRVCTHTDTTKACPRIYASPETSQSSTFSPEACHICTNNMSWLSEHASTLIASLDLEPAPEMNIHDEMRDKKLARANRDEHATLPSVLALEEGCVVRQMRFGGCTCVMEVITHSTSCYTRGISQCEDSKLLVAGQAAGGLWQEGMCAWCRGDTAYLLRYGDVVRRLEGSEVPAGSSGMGGDLRRIEN